MPITAGTTPNRKKNSPVSAIEMHTAAAMMSAITVVLLSSSDPIRRPGCIFTTDGGGATFGSSSGASSSFTRWATIAGGARGGRAGGAGCRGRSLPRARREAQDLEAQGIRLRGAEVGELHVGILPGDRDLELGGAEQSREQRPHDVDALDAVEPSSRWVRNTTPLLTSTSSSVMRNVCMRHDR